MQRANTWRCYLAPLSFYVSWSLMHMLPGSPRNNGQEAGAFQTCSVKENLQQLLPVLMTWGWVWRAKSGETDISASVWSKQKQTDKKKNNRVINTETKKYVWPRFYTEWLVIFLVLCCDFNIQSQTICDCCSCEVCVWIFFFFPPMFVSLAILTCWWMFFLNRSHSPAATIREFTKWKNVLKELFRWNNCFSHALKQLGGSSFLNLRFYWFSLSVLRVNEEC